MIFYSEYFDRYSSSTVYPDSFLEKNGLSKRMAETGNSPPFRGELPTASEENLKRSRIGLPAPILTSTWEKSGLIAGPKFKRLPIRNFLHHLPLRGVKSSSFALKNFLTSDPAIYGDQGNICLSSFQALLEYQCSTKASDNNRKITCIWRPSTFVQANDYLFDRNLHSSFWAPILKSEVVESGIIAHYPRNLRGLVFSNPFINPSQLKVFDLDPPWK